MIHKLTSAQQQKLRQVAGLGKDFVNPALDAVINMLKEQSPEAFHNKKTLAHRIFFHEPVTLIPYARCICARERNIFGN